MNDQPIRRAHPIVHLTSIVTVSWLLTGCGVSQGPSLVDGSSCWASQQSVAWRSMMNPSPSPRVTRQSNITAFSGVTLTVTTGADPATLYPGGQAASAGALAGN